MKVNFARPLRFHPMLKNVARLMCLCRASAGRATPLPSDNLQGALQTLQLLGLGGQNTAPTSRRGDVDTEEDSVLCGDSHGRDARERSGPRLEGRDAQRTPDGTGMEALLKCGRGPDSRWRDARGGGVSSNPESASGGGDGCKAADEDPGWRFFAGRMGREEAEALLR